MASYAITMADGSVAVMHTYENATVEQCLAKWTVSERGKVVSFVEIDLSVIPPDRTFRNSWRANGAVIEHDMDKARAIHLARIRRQRDAVLSEKDAEWMRATGTKDTVEAGRIEAERQALRDVPQTIDAALKAAATPDELKAVWPDELPERTVRVRA